MATQYRSLLAKISLENLLVNIEAANQTKPVVDLRADAYGHGAKEIASFLLKNTNSLLLVDDDFINESTIKSSRLVSDTAPTIPAAVSYGVGGKHAVMKLRSSLLQTKRLLSGEGVSYGHTFIAQQDTTIALVAGGYGQGIPRAIGNIASISIAKQKFPIIGRVAMDVCMVDCANQWFPPGEEVIFFGNDDVSITEWAGPLSLDPLEILSSVGQKVPKRSGW